MIKLANGWYGQRSVAGVALATMGLGLAVATGPTAVGATPTALNPPPSDSYVCTAVGKGTRCLSDTSEVLDPVPSGIFCGSGAGAYEVIDQATRRVKAERWYDADGNLVKRIRANLFSDASLSNPTTGTSVAYDQHDIDTNLLAVPGDLDTATTMSVEFLVASAPAGHSMAADWSQTTPTARICSRQGFAGGCTSRSPRTTTSGSLTRRTN